jgi:hypothetical protein
MNFPFWNSLVGTWRNVWDGLLKVQPTLLDEILKTTHVGRAMALIGCTHMKDFWDSINSCYKELKDFGVRRTIASITARNNLVANIPWDPCTTF